MSSLMIDYSLKQRLIGAVVLVILMVIIVPLLLDGQKEVVVDRSLIPEQLQKENNREIIVLDLKRNSPLPLNENRKEFINFERINEAIEIIKTYITNPKDKSESDTKKNTVIRDNYSNKDSWVIQLGSFSLVENANKKIQVLNSQGHEAYFVKNLKNNKVIYKVWLGPYRNKSEAEELSKLLFSDNHENQVVPY
jgi:DedD protein